MTRAYLAILIAACTRAPLPGPIESQSEGDTNASALDTILTAAPESIAQSPLAFSFEATRAASFQCRLDDAPWSDCASPLTVENATLGSRRFEVRAVAAGATDPTPASVEFTVVQDADYPNIAIIDANEGWVFGSGYNPSYASIDLYSWPRHFRGFYQLYPDDYMSLIVFTQFAVYDWFAFETAMQGGILGIGQDGQDELLYVAYQDYPWSLAGSAGALESIAFMNGRDMWPYGDQTYLINVLAQEFGHRWGAYIPLPWEEDPYVLLDDYYAHWDWFVALDTSSPMRDSAALSPVVDNNNGTFTTNWGTGLFPYASIDLYAMGLLGAAEVPDFFYVRDTDPPILPSPMPYNFTFSGDRVDVSMQQIIDGIGPRVPSVDDAPKSFRTAFLLVVPAGEEADVASLQWVDDIRRAWEDYFVKSTRGLGTVDTALFDATRGL